MSRTVPRVLLLVNELSLTGAPRLTMGLFQRLRGAASIRVVAEMPGHLESEYEAIGSVVVLDRYSSRATETTRLSAKVIARARDQLRQSITRLSCAFWRPDLTYVSTINALPMLDRIGRPASPVVLHVHERGLALRNFETLYPGLVQKIPSRYIAVSNVVADELVADFGILRSRISVVHPFVDVPSGMASQLRSQPGPIVVGGVGNPHWTKGVELWLLSCRAVADEMGPENVRFVWLGVRNSPASRQMQAMVTKLDLGGIVRLEPETHDPFSVMREFDILLVSSWEESASLATMEAMALGIPVVCFAGSGGPAEILGGTGVVIPAFAPQAAGEAIAAVARDESLRLTLRSKALARVKAEFDAEEVGAAWAQEVISLVAPRGS